jgi:hypothetical protein
MTYKVHVDQSRKVQATLSAQPRELQTMKTIKTTHARRAALRGAR